ncbi:MAG: OmpA family protein [Bacteroidota bacterium]
MKTTFTVIILFLGLALAAQPSKDFVETNSAKKSLRAAQAFINSGEYRKAEKQLRHTIKIKDDFAVAFLELGRVYMQMGKYALAIENLEMSFELDEKMSRAAFFECGEAYFKSDNVEMANYFYGRYEEMKGQSYANKQKESGLEISYDLLLRERQDNCAYIAQLDTTNSYDRPQNLGSNVNSGYDDYLPTITSDGLQLVFTRQEKNDNENVYICNYKKGQWGQSRSFGSTINTKKNEGMAKFETHGRAFYFAGCMRSDTEGGCDIYRASLDHGEVTEVKRLEGHLNSTFWDSQPTITCDGQAMYFSSTRKEGLGGADLWVSYLMDNGDWSLPQNLGPAINTPGDEEAPFISSDGQTLYFSSTGHAGQGDGDLFIARKVNGQWTQVSNMGFPINSPAKEMGFYVQGNGKTAYISSARKGGKGGLDIYKVELPLHLRPDAMVHVEGRVYDAETREPIAARTVRIGSKQQKWEVSADENGWFFICLPGNKGYSFQIEVPGYDYFIEAQFLESQDNVAPILVKLPLTPQNMPKPEFVSKGIEIREKRIQLFFEFDSYNISESTENELKALINLLQKEEDWMVEVVGYADNIGASSYNQKLSEKRAKAIVDYLKQSGITINKVVRNEGLGSLNQNNTENERLRSRRVDVILRK